MKKKLRKAMSVLLCIAILASVVAVSSFAASGVFNFKVTDFGYAELVSCSKSASGEITVPQTVKIDGKEYNVKSIGDNAFEGCASITRITISEGVTTIGAKAFASCTKLKAVDVPSTLLTCSYDAFDDCNTVTVNCYKSNYQFFTVFGFADNIKVNVVDGELDEEKTENVNSFVEILRRLIKTILSWFGIKLK
ncbi:MAG: leucine-rich repeat domain-containing protein [Acutalibacteraceae bacterium]